MKVCRVPRGLRHLFTDDELSGYDSRINWRDSEQPSPKKRRTAKSQQPVVVIVSSPATPVTAGRSLIVRRNHAASR